MGKAVLVLNEMPEKCKDCIVRGLIVGNDVCMAELKTIKSKKPNWCPLKPLADLKKS